MIKIRYFIVQNKGKRERIEERTKRNKKNKMAKEGDDFHRISYQEVYGSSSLLSDRHEEEMEKNNGRLYHFTSVISHKLWLVPSCGP